MRGAQIGDHGRSLCQHSEFDCQSHDDPRQTSRGTLPAYYKMKIAACKKVSRLVVSFVADDALVSVGDGRPKPIGVPPFHRSLIVSSWNHTDATRKLLLSLWDSGKMTHKLHGQNCLNVIKKLQMVSFANSYAY